jgi:hypothetical protein
MLDSSLFTMDFLCGIECTSEVERECTPPHSLVIMVRWTCVKLADTLSALLLRADLAAYHQTLKSF